MHIYGPSADPYSSYGIIMLELARQLARRGEPVAIMPTGDRITPGMDAELAEIAERPFGYEVGGVALGYPTNHRFFGDLFQRGPRVAVTMFESSRLPAGWVEPLNDCDAVIVPSTFCAEVFVACGVTAPIHVVPLGVNEVYRVPSGRGPRKSDRPLRQAQGRPFTFLAFLDRGARKGGRDAETAFVRAFGDSPDVRLILKSRKPRGVRLVCHNPNIEIIQQDMTPEELRDLYLSCDALINPNRGEGFGMLPREAAATGCIALATNWSGTADDIGLWGVPLPYTLGRAHWSHMKSLNGQDLGVWAEPDIDGCASVLREVFEHRDWYREEAIRKAPAVAERYTWSGFADRVLDIWKEVSRDYTDAKSAIAA